MQSNYSNMTLSELMSKISMLKQCSAPDKVVKFYLAAPWFSGKSKQLIEFVKSLQTEYSKRYNFDIYFPDEHNESRPCETFHTNCDAIDDADIVIALICEKDVGTAFEIGYAYASNKDVILVGYDETCFNSGTNIMLAFAGEAISIFDLPNYLLSKPYDKINVKNEWSTKQ